MEAGSSGSSPNTTAAICPRVPAIGVPHSSRMAGATKRANEYVRVCTSRLEGLGNDRRVSTRRSASRAYSSRNQLRAGDGTIDDNAALASNAEDSLVASSGNLSSTKLRMSSASSFSNQLNSGTPRSAMGKALLRRRASFAADQSSSMASDRVGSRCCNSCQARRIASIRFAIGIAWRTLPLRLDLVLRRCSIARQTLFMRSSLPSRSSSSRAGCDFALDLGSRQ